MQAPSDKGEGSDPESSSSAISCFSRQRGNRKARDRGGGWRGGRARSISTTLRQCADFRPSTRSCRPSFVGAVGLPFFFFLPPSDCPAFHIVFVRRREEGRIRFFGDLTNSGPRSFLPVDNNCCNVLADSFEVQRHGRSNGVNGAAASPSSESVCRRRRCRGTPSSRLVSNVPA